MKLGISSYTYTWAVGVPGYPLENPLTAMGLLDKAIDLGVSVVQIADNLPLDSLSNAELSELAAEAEARGVQIEVGTRGIQPAHLAIFLNLAQRLSSPILRVVIDTPNHHPTLPEVIHLINESLPAFVEAGVILAIENHDRFSVKDFVQIVGMLDNPYVGICLDTVNSFGALEGLEVIVETLAPWTVNLHIKDFKIRRADHMMGFTIEGAPAGRGQLDIPWLLGHLEPYRIDVNAILELWTPPEGDLAETIAKEDSWALESVRNLRAWIRN